MFTNKYLNDDNFVENAHIPVKLSVLILPMLLEGTLRIVDIFIMP